MRRGYVSHGVRRTCWRERILRAKLKHNIPGNTRNSIPRGPPWNSYIGCPDSIRLTLESTLLPVHPSLPLLAATVWQVFNITWKFWAAPIHGRYSHLSVTNAPQLYIVRGDASTEHSQPTEGKNIWSKGGDVFDRAASKLWGWIFCRHASPRLSRDRFKPVVFLPLDSRFVVFVARWPPIRGFRCSLAPDPPNRRLTRELCYAMERNFCATFH